MKLLRSPKLRFLACLFFCLTRLNAQTNIPASTLVSQNFNSMIGGSLVTLPANWKTSAPASSGTWGTGLNIVTQSANSGTPATGGSYNWGTSAGTDRSVGFMTDISYGSPNSIMAYFRNTTGSTITTITVLFAVERYRINTTACSLSFSSSADGTTWTPRTDGDIVPGLFPTGSSAYTFSTPQTVYKTVTITGLSVLNNADFYLRWAFNNGGSNSQGIGLDNVALYAGAATPNITAQLRDVVSIDLGVPGQANPGDQLTYTTVLKNIGAGNASNVILTQPIPNNTTLANGYITSALARDDSYSTAVNTSVTGQNVLTNDFGLPAPSLAVVSFGPSFNSSATAPGGSGSSDNGGIVTVNANGSFTYSPPSSTFSGFDKFSYKATTGTLPDNDATVTISVGNISSAVADAYNVIGNVSILPNSAAGILVNDAGTNNAIIAVNGSSANVGVPITTTGGGTLTVNANGSFTYDPLAGFDGPTDNFTYTIDNGFSSPSTATVTLNITGMVWFITNGGAAGDGRLSSPFNSIAAFQAVNNGAGNNPATGDNIFVFENAAAFTGSITLLNGQKLIGQDATVSLSTITGLTPNATYSTAFPAMNATAGQTSRLTTTVAATNAVNLNTSGGTNLLRGFTIGNTTGTGISGNGFGALTISDVSKNGTGPALALTSGSFAAGSTIDNITTTSSVNAISLTTVTGSLTISAGTISGTTGISYLVSGGSVSVVYSGGITQGSNFALLSVTGGHTGTLTMNTGTLSATNGTGLQFNNADGTYNFNGTTTLNGADAAIDIINGSGGTFSFGTGTSITNPSGTAFTLTGGTASITYSGNITKNNAGSLVRVTAGHNTGTVTFNTGTLSATTAAAGDGLQFNNADGFYNFNGTTTLNGGDAGVDFINGTGGTFTFGTGCAITNPTGDAFFVDGGSASITYSGNITKNNAGTLINIAGFHDVGTITFQTGTLSATGASAGNGIQFDDSEGTYNFNGTTTLNGGDAGIDIFNFTGGDITFGSGTSITNPTNEVITIVNRSSPNFIYSGTFLKNNNNITGISLTDLDGGIMTFNGTGTKTLSTGTANAIDITNNTGATINFAGNNLLLTTTSGIALNSVDPLFNVSSLNVSGTGNILTSTTGTALNVSLTRIGSSNLNFQSISSNGAATGISLSLTGNQGGLVVTGTGAANSGGTIQNASNGISLDNTANVSITSMSIQNTTQYGITGTGVVNFSFINGVINNSGTALGAQVSNIGFNVPATGSPNISGTFTVTGSTLTNAYYHGIAIRQDHGVISNLNISNNTFTSPTTAVSSLGSGIDIAISGIGTEASSITKGTINNNTISNFPGGSGISVIGGNTTSLGSPDGLIGIPNDAVNKLTISGNFIAGLSALVPMAANCITVSLNGKGQGNIDILSNGTAGNKLRNFGGNAISFTCNGHCICTGSINSNFIDGTANAAASAGIFASASSTFATTDDPALSLTINNNNIVQTGGNGILAQAIASAGQANYTIRNNTVAVPRTAGTNGIRVDAGNATSNDNAICIDIAGNSSAGSVGSLGIGLRKQGANPVINDFGIEGMVATATPGVEAYVNGLNPAGGGAQLLSATSGFINCGTAPRPVIERNSGSGVMTTINKK